MLAHSKTSPLFTQRRIPGQFDQPDGKQPFSPNTGCVPSVVFLDPRCTPYMIIVYVVIQFLMNNSRKCSTRNIAKYANLSHSAVKNARHLLSKMGLIVKQEDGIYLFKNFDPECSMALVGAKKVGQPHREYFVYWFPIDLLKIKTISSREKMGFALILSLISSGVSKIKIERIAKRLNISERTASRLIKKLSDEELISFHRTYCPETGYKSFNSFQIGVQTMVNHEENLSAALGGQGVIISQESVRCHPDDMLDCVINKQENEKGTPDDMLESTPDGRSLRIKKKEKAVLKQREDQEKGYLKKRDTKSTGYDNRPRTSDTYKYGQEKNISFSQEENQDKKSYQAEEAYQQYEELRKESHWRNPRDKEISKREADRIKKQEAESREWAIARDLYLERLRIEAMEENPKSPENPPNTPNSTPVGRIPPDWRSCIPQYRKPNPETPKAPTGPPRVPLGEAERLRALGDCLPQNLSTPTPQED